MRDVHSVLQGMHSWSSWTAAQQKLCMRVRTLFVRKLTSAIVSLRQHVVAAPEKRELCRPRKCFCYAHTQSEG